MKTEPKEYSIHKPLIGRFLDISTGHITEKDNETLRFAALGVFPFRVNATYGPNKYDWAPAVYKYDEGQFVHVPSSRNDLEADLKIWRANGLSVQFCKIMKLASVQGLEFVRFDGDGIQYNDLKTFNW